MVQKSLKTPLRNIKMAPYVVIALIFHIENERKSIQELKKKVGKRLEKYSKSEALIEIMEVNLI